MLELTISRKDTERIIKKFQDVSPRKKGAVIYDAFVSGGTIIERRLKHNLGGKILDVVTGRLRSSMQSRVDVTKDGIQAVIGSGTRNGERVKYADYLETSNRIRPSKRRYLSRTFAEVKEKFYKTIFDRMKAGLL